MTSKSEDVLDASNAQQLPKPELLVPALQRYYDFLEPVSWLLVRLCVGLMLLPHGLPKLQAGIQATAEMALVKRGIEPAEPFAVVIILLETLGGLCVALGLLTRLFALAIFAEMMVIVYHYFPKFGWTGPGYEYPLMWGVIMLAIAMRGGGPYALDNKLRFQI
jgi:putative oxidoreductase